MVAGFDPRFKVNPPLRRSEDTLALREAVGQGIIDIVATDHAPHSSESKDCSFEEAAFGMLGLETALPVVLHTLVEPGHITMADVGRILSSGPAKIGSLRGYDSPLALGSPAHLTLVDPAQRANAVRGSLSSNNPFEGLALPGSVRHTFFGGNQTVENGHLCEPERVSSKKGEIS
jgi:dihydroorotase